MQALPAKINNRKVVGSDGVLSLSFGPFLSLCHANKEKEKDIYKTKNKKSLGF